ncbi:SprB repeat-containing protein [Anaerophaga thermohalophila]|uniref:SprB repeat-containing protein n=1 Tax=Anaerophaga thermohalophila TaxID=177400 RepID=UPI0002F42215|nr:SprB repeat-containing protein [Anaerophaga thermohalophila]
MKLNEPGPIKIDTTFYFPKCNSANSDTKSLFTGSIEFLIESGGIPDFFAKCVNNETNDTTVIDSFGQIEIQKFSELEPGAYTLKIWDNGDTARERAPVFSKDFFISEKAEMTFTATPTNVSCKGGTDGSIALQVTNGTPSFSFTATGGNSGSFQGNSRAHTIEGLGSGEYTVTVTDNNGCKATEDSMINEPTKSLSIESIGSTSDTCDLDNGSLTFEVSGGWDNKIYEVTLSGSSLDSNKIEHIEAGSTDKSVTFSDLPAGTDYIVTVTNDGSCETSRNNLTVVEYNPLNEIKISQKSQASCNAVNDAVLHVENTHLLGESYTLKIDNVQYFLDGEGDITDLASKSSAILEITDTLRGCVFNTTLNITGIPPVSIDTIESIINPSSCATASNGSVHVRGDKGRGGYKYRLEGEDEFKEDSVFVGKSSGRYKIYIQDSVGCENFHIFKVPHNENPISIETITPQNASCETSEDGAILLENITHNEELDLILACKRGGENIIPEDNLVTYGDDREILNLASDDYIITLSDENNCSLDTTINLKHNSYSPSFTPLIIDSVACSGKNNGRISIHLEQAGDYSYELFQEPGSAEDPVDSGSFSDTDSFIIDGLTNNPDYEIRVTDGKGCIGTKTFKMPVINNSLSLFTEPVPASCEEVSNGELHVSAEGGYPFDGGKYKFSYEKNSSGEWVSSISGNWIVKELAVGDILEVKVEDKYGCVNEGELQAIPIKNNPTEIINIKGTNPACIGAASGVLDVDMQWTPETTGYEYSLFSLNDRFECVDTITGTLDENNPSIGNLSKGKYELKVTDSDGCSDVFGGVELFDPDSLTVSVDHNYIRVKDESTGEFTMNIRGGNNKYEVGWITVPEGNVFDNTTIITDSVFAVENLSAGNYMLALRDTANCPYFEGESWFTREIEIAEPEKALSIATDNVINVSCNKYNDGRIEVEAEGGWGPYSYSINGNERNSSGIFEGLPAGEYSIEVTDTAGVSINESYRITEPDTLNILIDNVRDATCPLYANGRVEATTINGIDDGNGLHYHIENIDDQSVILGEKYDDREYDFHELPKGNYELFVTDAHNCFASKTFAVDEPDTAIITYRHNYIRAKGDNTGEIASEISGGNGVFDYKLFKTGDSMPFSEGRTSGNIAVDSLFAGSYTLMVRDTAGCIYEDEEWMIRRISIAEPDTALHFDIKENRAVSCHGLEDGVLEVTPVGGWGHYLIRMNQGSFDETRLFDNLDADEYTITVRDSAGVEFSEVITVSEPDTLRAILAKKTDVACFGDNTGGFSLDISGGNLSYLISVDGENWVEGSRMSNLPRGLFVPHVKDTLGCSVVLDAVFIDQPDKISLVKDSVVRSRCSNNEGSIFASFEGGVGEFNYEWFKDSLFSDGNVEQVLLEGENMHNIDSLYSGRYQIIVTDENECSIPFEFFVDDISDLTIDSIETKDVWCWGDSNGEAVANVSKGNPPYYYTWSENVGNSSGTLASDIPAGDHHLLVSDSKGCKAHRAFSIGTPDSVYFDTLSFNHPLCLGGRKGNIEIEGTGGTPGYTYQWTNGASASRLDDLDPGSYLVTITDSHNCSSTFAFDLDYERTLHPYIGSDTVICHYDELILDAGDYSRFNWSTDNGNVASTRRLTINDPGSYYLMVEDADNCLGFDTLTLDVSTLEIADLTVNDVTCANAADGNAAVEINSSDENYSVIWPDGTGENSFTGLSGGNYNVRVENSLGCFDLRSFTVSEPEPLSLMASISEPLCYGVFDGQIDVTALGGNGDYRYVWLHGPTTSSLKRLDAGAYSLIVSDEKNCSITDTYEIEYQRTLYPQLGDDLTLCSEAAGYLTPGSFEGYRWFFEGKEISNDSSLIIEDAGSYIVEVSDEDDCLAYDTVVVNEQHSELLPEFLMATSVPLGDTLMIVDVTTPKPAGLEWAFSGSYEIVEEGDYYCEVIFNEEGIHFVTLSALMDQCLGQARKQILVTPEAPKSEGIKDVGGSASIFNSMKVYPNPTDEVFRVDVELKEAASINLYLVHLQTGQILEKDRLSGLSKYTKEYNITGTGQFVVFVECRGERLMQKVIVK